VFTGSYTGERKCRQTPERARGSARRRPGSAWRTG